MDAFRLKKAIKFLVLCLIISLTYLALEFIGIYDNQIRYSVRLFSGVSIFSGIAFSLVSTITIIFICSIFFIKNRWFFLTIILINVIFYVFNSSYSNINGSGIGYNDFVIIFNEANGFALEAIQSFKGEAINPLIFSFFFLVFSFLVRTYIERENLFIKNKFIALSFLLSFGSSFAIIYKTDSSSNNFSSIFRVANTALYASIKQPYYGPRYELKEQPYKKEDFKNIILIVDESITGNHLSINNHSVKTTPYLQRESNIINLGLASSITNCSASSNIILQSGLQPEMLPDKNFLALKKADIFQYAKNADYSTAYISNQSYEDKLQNNMTVHDVKHIDYFYQPKKGSFNKEQETPEGEVISKIKKQLDSSNKNFIFVVKRGSHFHYESNYPSSGKVFTPTLEAGETMSIKNKEKALNSYHNSIRWNVDKFFERFFEDIKIDSETLIIYTSDHGQSLLDDGKINTHCSSSNPSKNQGLVPLILFTKNGHELERLIIKNKNKLNSFSIFPSIINFMGYDTEYKTFHDDFYKEDQFFFSGDIFGFGALEKNNIN